MLPISINVDMLIDLDEIYRMAQTATSYIFKFPKYKPPMLAKSPFFATFTPLTPCDHETNTFSEANSDWIRYRNEFSTTLSLCIFDVFATLKVLWRSKVRRDWKFGELATLLHYAALTISFRANLRLHFKCRIACSPTLSQSHFFHISNC